MTSQRTRIWEDSPDLQARFVRAYADEREFVRGVIRRMGVLPGDVEDAVQDVFMVLHRRLHELDTGMALRFWLRSVAIRVCRNHRRKQLARPTQAPGAESIDPDTLHDVVQHWPDHARAVSEARQLVARALERLDAKKKRVFLLTELEERSAREIAELLQTSPNTVSSRLRAARKRLANAVRSRPSEYF